MKFNVVPTNRLYVEAGSKVLTEPQLASLSDGITVSGVALAAGETLSVIVDLDARYNLDELFYYRSAAAAETLTVYGKQNDDDVWNLVSHTDDGTKLTALLTGPKRFQLLRLTHAVTTGSAEAFELEVFTSEDEVLFGSSGNVDNIAVDSGTSLLTPQEIPVYNPDTIPHDFYCLLDATDPDSFGLSLAVSGTGPFEAIHETGISLPDDFAWSSGSFDNTVESSNTVVLISGVAGAFYTPVIDVQGLEGRRFFWEATVSGTTELDITTSIDNIATTAVRYSDTAPTDGGWVSGQISSDSNWHVLTGALPFEPTANDVIVEPRYRRYFQAKIEFISAVDGQTPVLKRVGIEEAVKVTVPAQQSQPVYVKSNLSDHETGRPASLISWYFESRDV